MIKIAPSIKEKFESLSPELQNRIIEQQQDLNSIYDLINVLEIIVAEDEKAQV